MKPSAHVAVSAAAAATVYVLSDSLPMTLACMASGVLIDLDHVFDYVREHRSHVNVRHFFAVFRATTFRRLVLPLHSWELMATLWVLAFFAGWPPVLTGGLIGATLHLGLDQLFNRVTWRSYFLIWRIACRFHPERTFEVTTRR